VQMQQEKEQFLAGKLKVKEAVNRELRSVTVLETHAEDQVEHQVEQLMEAIQHIQQRVEDLEFRTMPNTSQDVRDQREVTAQSTIERIKDFSMECKQLSDCSSQTYDQITKNV
jgi:vacuolar-type H+-ATPase subunit D/Vma8